MRWLMVLVGVLFGVTPISAQTAEQILDQVAKRYANFKSLRVQSTIVVESSGIALRTKVTQQHQALYARPNLMKATWKGGGGPLAGPKEMAVVCDGQTLFVQADTTVRKTPAAKTLAETLKNSPLVSGREVSVDEVSLFAGTPWRKIAKSPKLAKKELLNGKPCFVISFQTPQGSQSLWIGQKDYLIWRNRTVITDSSGPLGGQLIVTETFSAMIPNPPFKKTDFVFKPPPKAQVAEKPKEKQPTPLEGKAAPDFQLPDLSGKTVSLSDFKGKPVVINFFAHW